VQYVITFLYVRSWKFHFSIFSALLAFACHFFPSKFNLYSLSVHYVIFALVSRFSAFFYSFLGSLHIHTAPWASPYI